MIWWLAFEKKPFQIWREIWIQVLVILLQLYPSDIFFRYVLTFFSLISDGLGGVHIFTQIPTPEIKPLLLFLFFVIKKICENSDFGTFNSRNHLFFRIPLSWLFSKVLFFV